MMQTDIHRQTLTLDGKLLTPADILRMEPARQPEALRDLFLFLHRWFDGSPFMEVHTSGSTGSPKALKVEKEKMMASACLTCEALRLFGGTRALLCMNLRYIGAMMVVVRALTAGWHLTVRPASGHPLSDVTEDLDFTAMVPLQVFNSLNNADEKRRLDHIRCLIIGGGAVDEALCDELQSLHTAVYSSYGMTETLSHIALRRLNGSEASACYRPFAGIHLALSAQGTLVIDAPALCASQLTTHDMVHLHADGSFEILGRCDNVIVSGGIKVQAEEVERRLRPLLGQTPYVITSVPDARLGEAVVLLVATPVIAPTLRQSIAALLPRYHVPRHICAVEHIPQVGNGKTDRPACRKLAENSLG